MNIDKIISLPFKSMAKLLIGGIINIIPIVNIMVFGYFLECYENGAKDHARMPEWENWGQKFVNGILFIIILLIYSIIPLLLIFPQIINMINWGYISCSMALLIIGIILFFIISFILQMAIANFAVKKYFTAAFEWGYIFKLIRTSIGSYIGAYFLMLLAMMITFFITMIPIVGWLFAILAGFYLYCVQGFLFGSVYGKATGILNEKYYLVEDSGACDDTSIYQQNFNTPILEKNELKTVSIYCVSGEYAGNFIEINAKGCVIGRDPEQANLVLTSESVSRKHAHIYLGPTDGSIIIKDFNSKNGTFVQKAGSSQTSWKRVTGMEYLTKNDLFRIGKNIVIFKVQ